jgi:hypothetical protein
VPKIDPKLFINMAPPSALMDFDGKFRAKKEGDRPRPWRYWRYAIPVPLIIALARLLGELFSSKPNAE